jgi:YD repeat-containing protein
MSEQTAVTITAPTMPKGGGAIQGTGNGLGAIGSSGTASCEIALPVSPGRGYAPAMTLRYSNTQGNGIFGFGWKLSLAIVSRRTHLGVPAYTNDDLFVGPSGEVWMPERDKTTGERLSSYKMCSNGKQQVQHTVVRYRPRIEAAFDLIEHWSSTADKPGFWLIHNADGSQHLFGKTPSARRTDPDEPSRVGEWLLEESMNAQGEHILYEYNADQASIQGPADYRAQRYLSRVRYGNFKADSQLYLSKVNGLKDANWHFELCFDYGERGATPSEKPEYQAMQSSPVRSDPFSDFTYGFELRTQRLCQQILMFHYFPNETSMGTKPVLVRRTLFEYHISAFSYSCLSAALDQAYGESSDRCHPPLEFTYTDFTLEPDVSHYKPFEALSRLNHQQHFQFVDLLGEGLPGVLHRTDKSWRYSPPLRDDGAGDLVTYTAWDGLPQIPLADSRKPHRQILGDLDASGRPDWILAYPGLSGFFTLNPDGRWSNFTSFTAVPTEFFHPQGHLVNLMGAGLSDLVMLGPRSVRLYAKRKGAGFATATEVARQVDEDDLPLPGNSVNELVAFSDLLGSGQQHLIRIRHNEVKCWPNLGRGRFGRGRVIATLDFSYEEFDASRVLLADLDGSGGADLIYLLPECARIFMNRCGNGLSPAIDLPWPEGLRYDRFCQVSATDLQGLGCSSLVLSGPGETPRHWRYDFVDRKPYLLQTTNNNMGASGSIHYRSSAQEWLDEKKQLLKHKKPAVSLLPFPLFLVKRQTQYDEITGNRLTQQFKYRRGFYDNTEREFQGFGLLLQTDSPTGSGSAKDTPHTPSKLVKTWFHNGEEIDLPTLDYNRSDKAAIALGATVMVTGETREESQPALEASARNLHARHRELTRALRGRILRVETYGRDQDPKTNHPYSVEQHRYLIRELRGMGQHNPYSIVHPVVAESISYQYERIPDDPRCTHSINLEWDAYGHLTHSLEISYARRKTKTDPSPFTDIWQSKWWGDAHDEEQQYYYLKETKAQFINIDTQGWHLGLRYLQRTNALKLPKPPLSRGLEPKIINYENLLELSTSSAWKAGSVMTGLSLQRYRKPGSSVALADGQASVEALVDHLETAELNEVALSVYNVLKAPFDRTKQLQDNGYKKMPIALAADEQWDTQNQLWSVRRHFSTYADLDGFFRVLTYRASQQHEATTVVYDPYYCLTTTVKHPDNCTTTASNIDYRIFQPQQITDPNGNLQEALYDVFGQVKAITLRKISAGEDISFKPISTYIRYHDERPGIAIEDTEKALQGISSAYFYDPFSWMGHIPATDTKAQEWRMQAVEKRDLLPNGYIRARARTRLADLKTKTPYEQELQKKIEAVMREPVHCATLLADRYLTDTEEKQIRIVVACQDGFGRQLQNKQKVEPGIAWTVDEDGTLKHIEGKPQEHHATHRWRVSERTEYDSKGLVVRIYRPYFSDRHRYINDEPLRKSGFCDQHFHDPLGRLVRVINAKGDERRYTYFPWYSMTEDENDTQPDTPLQHTPAHGGAQ